MKLQVLGSYGGDFKGRFPAFLVNNTVLMDAGTIGTALTLEKQLEIKTILLTHHHIDHMLGIPFFSDAIYGNGSSPVEIFALESVNKNLKSHLLNDVLWPDFTALPSRENPTIRCNNIDLNTEYNLPDGLSFTTLPTCHIGPSCGYIVCQDDVGLVYSGDTGICKPFWTSLTTFRREHPSVSIQAIIIECSFPSNRKSFAVATRHLTPELLAGEFENWDGERPDIMIFHMKPKYMAVIEQEIRALLGDRVWMLRPDEEYSITRDGIRSSHQTPDR